MNDSSHCFPHCSALQRVTPAMPPAYQEAQRPDAAGTFRLNKLPGEGASSLGVELTGGMLPAF